MSSNLRNLSREQLLNCITKIFKDENEYIKQKAEELKNNGIVVIDLHLNQKHHNFIHKTKWIEIIRLFCGYAK